MPSCASNAVAAMRSCSSNLRRSETSRAMPTTPIVLPALVAQRRLEHLEQAGAAVGRERLELLRLDLAGLDRPPVAGAIAVRHLARDEFVVGLADDFPLADAEHAFERADCSGRSARRMSLTQTRSGMVLNRVLSWLSRSRSSRWASWLDSASSSLRPIASNSRWSSSVQTRARPHWCSPKA